jgi:hypothetical protein
MQHATLTLDWTPNPDHVGFYYARDEGIFRKAGLDVAIHAPSDPAAPLKLVAAGRSDLAVSYEQEVFFAAAKKLPVVAVASVIGQPLNSFMSIEPSVRSLADLEGRSVGITGVPADYAALATAGLEHDVKVVNVGYSLLPALLSHKVDAVLGVYRNVEGIDLTQRGYTPTVIPLDRAGVPTYDELVLVAERRPAALEQGLRGRGREVRGRLPPGLGGGAGASGPLARDPGQGNAGEAILPRRLDAGHARAARERLPEQAGLGPLRRVDARARPARGAGSGCRRDDDPLPRAALPAVGPARPISAHRRREDVREPAAGAGDERLASQGVEQSVGRDSTRRAVQGEERDKLSFSPAEPALDADDVDERVAEDRVHLDTGEPVGSEDQQLTKEMVEAALDPAYDEDACRLVGQRCAERELEVGRVLVDRVALDRPRGLDRRRCRESKSPTRGRFRGPARGRDPRLGRAATTRAPGGIASTARLVGAEPRRRRGPCRSRPESYFTRSFPVCRRPSLP